MQDWNDPAPVGPSSRHSKLESLSPDENANDTDRLETVPDGPVPIDGVGATVSTRTVRGAEAGDVPPALLAVVVYTWLPSAASEIVTDQIPAIEAVVDPRLVEPSCTVTRAPAVAVPLSTKVELRLQLSSAGEEMIGAAGAGVPPPLPTLTVRADDSAETLRARSTARAV